MNVDGETFRAIWDSHYGKRPIGHAHFWEQMVARRRFLAGGAAVGAGVLSSALWPPLVAQAAATPKPIPRTALGTPLHGQPPIRGVELSTITDFDGILGVADLDGVGVGSDGPGLTFNVDMRFMQGKFIATDGQLHQGTFGFV